ncbi:MAG: tRNA (guanosine(37)-N1)-methyltransferase TrmD [Candidatus Levybacteria bacterium RIFCSPHIGHO2_01_FULL_36_15]|nr:MAG: tRNA (guanosine(37)-N1)-methyltransferase TrmD [Candidatus Levybacteria bacterium RIFCSPHIGHO2_01_FULL_36_15]OGH39005.1 MAG: tRNA (guanosine(37)-N1)-methyltransferase TrmD [Candidatus Levybacteria bacterium RIFCSPLOWO2_01_FULL_36_10]
MFEGIFNHSIIKRAQKEKLIKIKFINLRDFGIGTHRTVDDRPYGGGTGMILRVDVVDKAVQSAKEDDMSGKVVLLDPKGKTYNQKTAENFSKLTHLILICGHYEGYDERIRNFVDEEISVGDYVLSGGEIPAMLIVDSVARLIPDVLKKQNATSLESFSKIGSTRILEYPQYTRPGVYKGKKVPEILLSGDLKKIEEYRLDKAVAITKKRRKDLLKSG